jgi:DeoR family transcriptional regulator of aga operon
MFPEERRDLILEILRTRGRIRVNDLARDLGVSEVTIRQDLDLLEKNELLRRTHGGAILNRKISEERPFQQEETSFKEEKERIGKAAAEMVTDGDTVFLDVGTTLNEVARCLRGKNNVTVITNALNIALLLEGAPGITLIVTGGTLREKQHSLVNPYGSFIINQIHADLALIGATGIEVDHGVTNVNIAEAEIKSLFIKNAEKSILLCDSSKIGNVSLAKVAELSEIDLLITDNQAEPKNLARLAEKGLQIKRV